MIVAMKIQTNVLKKWSLAVTAVIVNNANDSVHATLTTMINRWYFFAKSIVAMEILGALETST